ncbi:MAG: IPTL-CTERM sorting domain-containing protein [Planctomycetes bacterium]|nr:IPTL-CTERM sorting domain-containing protein [Planctomycetota bacterium]
MSRLIRIAIATALVAMLSPQLSVAGEWTFHFSYYDCPGGNLQVWGTIDCVRQDPPLFEGYVTACETYRGAVPGPPINDVIFDFAWDWWCGNVDHIKFALPGWNGDTSQWELGYLPPWIDAHVTTDLITPSIGDPTGTIQIIYVIVNLEEFAADPRPPQPYYTIVNGRCPDLPGYLIGTTPIVFDPNAPQSGYPFSTTPLTGTLEHDGEIIFYPSPRQTPTVSEWGLIVMALLLLAAGTIIVRRRRHSTAPVAG